MDLCLSLYEMYMPLRNPISEIYNMHKHEENIKKLFTLAR